MKEGMPMEDRYNVECCDFIHIHKDLVEKVRRELPGEDTLYDLTELFRIFGDSTRIRILYVLFESEMCVCDDPVRHLPPAAGFEKRPSGLLPPGGENRVLRPGGRPCENHH